MDTREKIFKLMKDNQMTKYKLAKKIGISNGIVSDWSSGKSSSYTKYIGDIAKIFNVSVDCLIQSEKIEIPKYKGVKIPVLGNVAAGVPIEAIENIDDWEEIPEEMVNNGEYFGLAIKGNSMEPRICQSDVVIV